MLYYMWVYTTNSMTYTVLSEVRSRNNLKSMRIFLKQPSWNRTCSILVMNEQVSNVFRDILIQSLSLTGHGHGLVHTLLVRILCSVLYNSYTPLCVLIKLAFILFMAHTNVQQASQAGDLLRYAVRKKPQKI